MKAALSERSGYNFLKDVTVIRQDLGDFVSSTCPNIRSLTAIVKQPNRGLALWYDFAVHSFLLPSFICSTSTRTASAMSLALETDTFPLFEKLSFYKKLIYKEYASHTSK